MWREAGTRQAIDLGHPTAQGLVFAYMGGIAELLSGSPLLTKTTGSGRAYIVPARTPGQTAFNTNTTNSQDQGSGRKHPATQQCLLS